jgi:hypothetical protein
MVCSSSEADWPIAGAPPRANRAFTGTRLRIPHCFGSNAESVMRVSYVNDSNHLRQRATEMRASSKELKDSYRRGNFAFSCSLRPARRSRRDPRQSRSAAGRSKTKRRRPANPVSGCVMLSDRPQSRTCGWSRQLKIEQLHETAVCRRRNLNSR